MWRPTVKCPAAVVETITNKNDGAGTDFWSLAARQYNADDIDHINLQVDCQLVQVSK